MKELIAAALIMTLIIGGWLLFLHYADEQSQHLTKEIRQKILPDIKNGSWAAVQKNMDILNEDWHRFRKITLYLLHSETINSIDYSVARAIKYAEAEDESNTSGELNVMIEQLSFLTSNQKLTLQNIF